jgi:hypothetical protein
MYFRSTVHRFVHFFSFESSFFASIESSFFDSFESSFFVVHSLVLVIMIAVVTIFVFGFGFGLFTLRSLPVSVRFG